MKKYVNVNTTNISLSKNILDSTERFRFWDVRISKNNTFPNEANMNNHIAILS